MRQHTNINESSLPSRIAIAICLWWKIGNIWLTFELVTDLRKIAITPYESLHTYVHKRPLRFPVAVQMFACTQQGKCNADSEFY